MKKFLVLVFAILLIFSPVKAAASYYVSSSGNDSNPGTLTQPWKTIGKAADTVSSGDTILVRSGTYNNGITLKRAGITLQAYPGEHPVLSGGNWYGFSDYGGPGASYTVIDGFEIVGGEFGIYFSKLSYLITLRNNIIHGQTNTGISIINSTGGEVSGNTVYGVTGYNGFEGDGLTGYDIRGNTVYNNNQNGIMVSASPKQGTTGTKIHSNIAYNNGCGSTQSYAGLAVEVNSSGNTVYNNLVYANCHSGYITNSSNNGIYNNVFYSNSEYQVLFGDWSGSKPENNIFENNVFVVTNSAYHAVGNFHSGTTYSITSNKFDYNDYWYSQGIDLPQMVRLDSVYSFAQWKAAGNELHGMLANPQFVGGSDFHLTANSPLIGKGTAAITDDFAGAIRVTQDIGAFVAAVVIPTQTLTLTPIPPTLTPSLTSTLVPPTATYTPSPIPCIWVIISQTTTQIVLGCK